MTFLNQTFNTTLIWDDAVVQSRRRRSDENLKAPIYFFFRVSNVIVGDEVGHVLYSLASEREIMCLREHPQGI